MNTQFYQTFGLSATEASHSWIGTATPIDYNLANMQKNGVIFVNITVSAPPVTEPIAVMPIEQHGTPELERARLIWGETPGGMRLSELVTDQRS
jgi:hypothetical protein